MDQEITEEIAIRLVLLASDPRVTAEDDAAIMQCEWLGGRLPAPPVVSDLDAWCDGGCPDDCDWCACYTALREWEWEWARAWDAVVERIMVGDDGWELDFHFRP